jgi:transcriptional regulator with XRE-family HTH domain
LTVDDHRLARERLGSRVRDARRGASLTIAELGGLASLSPSMISQIERGSADPSIRALRRLSAALGLPVHVLLDDDL